MERDILHLYQRAQAGPLEAKEVHWLENQVNEFPYFALPRIILARHKFQKDQDVKSRQLLEGAAYSLDRGHFRNYLYMSLPAETSKVEEKETDSESHAISSEKVASVSTKDIAAKDIPESKAAKPETKASKSEPTTESKVSKSEPQTASAKPNSVGKINWFLNTRVQMRTNRYLGQYGKIKANLFSPDVIEKTEVPKPAIEEVKSEAPAVLDTPRIEALPPPDTSKAEEPGIGSSAPSSSSKTTLVNDKGPIIESPSSEESTKTPKTKEEKAKAVEALLASRRAKSAKEAEERKTEEEKAADYEIGSFSSFSFVDDAEGGEAEVNSLVQAGEVVSLQTPTDPVSGYSELVIENNDRRLEILVTPEELEKYFKGKLPAVTPGRSHGLSATDDEPMHLQFNFSVSDAELEDDLAISNNDDISSRTEVQNLSAKSSPELISIAPSIDAERDEERERELIDKFIEHEPSITRGGHVHALAGDLAKESLKDEDDWVTETLAKVFVMQGNNARAIRIYKKLTLLFPEKRAYFDVQISKLKR